MVLLALFYSLDDPVFLNNLEPKDHRLNIQDDWVCIGNQVLQVNDLCNYNDLDSVYNLVYQVYNPCKAHAQESSNSLEPMDHCLCNLCVLDFTHSLFHQVKVFYTDDDLDTDYSLDVLVSYLCKGDDLMFTNSLVSRDHNLYS